MTGIEIITAILLVASLVITAFTLYLVLKGDPVQEVKKVDSFDDPNFYRRVLLRDRRKPMQAYNALTIGERDE